MPLALGSRIATYEIVANLGAGGMGEVYRARDSKLNRDVALKILPEAFADDADRRARFDREAKALAALNHPNIAQVYDSGTSDGTSFLVMEMVAGEDLSERIARGPLPVADALAIAGQIVAALETAHEAGIIHRDLKPGNIKVRRDGTVKVLDFGLARPAPDSRISDPREFANSPTITSPLTVHGVILGTAAYMSPEQARGEVVDRRSDIWAFGAVLYEMLTGRRPFDGEHRTDVMAAVVRLEPDWSALPPDLPPAIQALLQGCLAKDRSRRVADISTARFVIDRASSFATAAPAASRTTRRWPIALAAGTALIAILSLAFLWTLSRPAPATVTRYTVTPDEDHAVVNASGVDVALSPDGSWMVYVGRAPGGGTRLLRRNLDDLEATPLPGSEGAAAPAVSPDGRSIAFVATGAIRTLALEGGPPFTVVNAAAAPAWSEDGGLYYGLGNLTYRVPARGGDPVAVTTALPNLLQQLVDPLPGGRGLLMTLVSGTAAQSRIAVVGPEGGTPRPVLSGSMARYVAGHIIYSTASGSVLAVPFDVQRLEVTGPPVPLVDGVEAEAFGDTHFAVSRSGSLLYTTGTGPLGELVWVTRAGVATPVDSSWIAEFGSPVLSPDGTRVAVAIQGQESKDIWILQLDRGSRIRLTQDGARNDFPAWTADGAAVTFASDRASPSFDLWTKRGDGSGEPALELDEEWAIAESLWSPVGRWLVHRTSTNVQGAGDIYAQRKSPDTKPIPIVASRFTETAPSISPNGRWMAYASSETGRSEIVVVPFPNAGDGKWPVSVGGGAEPLWSRDGSELFYRNGRGELVAVTIKTNGTLSIGETLVLFSDRDYVRLGVRRQYDVTPDGQRFLMIRPIGAGRERQLILVRNVLSKSRPGTTE
jgi:serine/threonine-protein kinase